MIEDMGTVVCFDCNTLVCLSGQESEFKTKLLHLLSLLDKKKGKAILPAPAIGEYLVLADQAGLAIVESLQKHAYVQVANFDLACAFECALLDAAAIGRGDKKDGAETSWQKVKYDRQIVAIAKRNGAKLIISNDNGVRANASRIGLKALSIDELSLPDHARQHKLPMPERKPK